MRNAITQEYIYSYASLLMPHCPVTVVQRYRDRVCNALFHLFFIICHLYIPLHLDFLYLFYRFLAVPNAPSKHIKENCINMQNISITAHMHYRDTELDRNFICKFYTYIVDTSLPLFSHFFRYAARGDRTRTVYDAMLLTSTLCYTRRS